MSDSTDQRPEGGTNARPLDDTIAGTGPGIPDDGLAPGQDELPTPPTDEEVAAAAKALGVDLPSADDSRRT
jgi:hypothetical protein